jgi:thermopsin
VRSSGPRLVGAAATLVAIIVLVGILLSPTGSVSGTTPLASPGSPSPEGSAGVAPLDPGRSSPTVAAGAAPTPPSALTSAARYAGLLSGAAAAGLRPGLIHLPSTEPGGVVDGRVVPGPQLVLSKENITTGYSPGPAPAGIGYYGESGSNVPGESVATSVDTSSLAGTLNVTNFSSLYFDTDNPDQWGTQLNAVLVNLSLHGSTNDAGLPYSLWAQNTISYQNLNETLSVNDNTWNLTSGSAGFATTGTSTVVANDSTDLIYGGTLYVGVGPYIYAPPPFNLTLYLNTSLFNPFICSSESSVATTSTCADPVTGSADYVGDETLFYNYSFHDDRTGASAKGTYDWLTFHTGAGSVFDPSNTRVSGFEADGYATDAIGLTNDWELDVGIGAFSGAGQVDFNGTGTADLQYVPDCTSPTPSLPSSCSPPGTPAFHSVPAALNFGSETGETASGLSVDYGAGSGTSTTAFFSAGPLNLHPLWGYTDQAGVVSGSTTVANQVTVSGHAVTAEPYVFVFFNDTSVNSPAASFAWAPDVPAWHLMPGVYRWAAMLSDYTEQTGVLDVGTSPTALTAVLPYDAADGVYTPLWALDNAELAGISSGGNGSLSNQFLLFANPTSAPQGQLNSSFGEYNDYAFPTFAGLLLWGTTAYVEVADEVPFLAGSFGPGYGAYLQEELYQTSHVTVTGSAILGWPAMSSIFGPSAAQNPLPQANLMIWDSSDDLVFNASFIAAPPLNGFVSPDALMFYGGSDNVVWGNTFSDPSGVTLSTPGTFAGVAEAEDGDLLFNNNFQVDNPVPFMVYNPYTETPGPLWNDRWNATEGLASIVSLTFNGFMLRGNILGAGQLFQGGNIWWNYGNSLNPSATVPFTNVVDYTDSAIIFPPGLSEIEPSISVGGDAVPLPGFTVSFSEENLPAGVDWQVTLFGVTLSSNSSTISFVGLPDGAYDYEATSIADWTAPLSSGLASVDGAPITIFLVWAQTTYRATFTESKLPANLVWSITVNQVSESLLTDGSTESLLWTGLSNGTYPYSISAVAGWQQSTTPYSGVITVSGGDQPTNGSGIGFAESLTYAPATYAVTFQESGLPSGTLWYLNVTGGAMYRSTTTVINVTQPNGTFSYALASSTSEYAPDSRTGSVTVRGAAFTQDAGFAQVTFPITMSETGLSTGTEWWVNLTNGQSFSSTGNSIAFREPNGTYEYTASSPGRLAVTGDLTVQGTPLTPPGVAFSSNATAGGLTTLEEVGIAVVVALVAAGIVLALWRRGAKRSRRSRAPASRSAKGPPPSPP